jgi:cysteine desulfuration protein SufE
VADPAEGLPPQLAEIVEDFQALTERDRLQLLLEFSRELPALPERYAGHPDEMEPVPECQSPVFLAVEVGGNGSRDEPADPDDPDDTVHVFFQAPAEAPTTRGFASILRAGLDGLPAAEVLAVPDDVSYRLGLTDAVSPLRLRGMAGMLARIKRRVREETSA